MSYPPNTDHPYASSPTPYTGPPVGAERLDLPLYEATFGQAVSRFWKKGVTFSGRASRSEYWWWILVSLLASIVFVLIGIATTGSLAEANATPTDLGDILSYVWSLAVLVPGLALSWRRLHDTNHSGLWILIALIPLVGAVILLVFYCSGPRAEGARFDA